MAVTRKVAGVVWSQDTYTMQVRDVNLAVWQKDLPSMLVRDVGVAMWQQAQASAQLRAVKGFAFQTTQPSAQIRAIKGYAFQNVQLVPNTSVTTMNALLALINNNSVISTKFDWTMITPSALAAYTDPKGAVNTSLLITAKPSSGYSGHMTLYYRRISLSVVFATGRALPSIPSATTIYNLLPQLNSLYGLNLAQSDLVDGPVKANATFIGLTASATSYMFLPGSTAIAGLVTALTQAVPKINLPGFDNAAGVGPSNQTPTVFLSHFDGGNGGTTATDDAGHVITMSGGAQLTNVQAKFGSTALAANAAGNIVSVADAPELRFAAGSDFTIEFFVYNLTLTGDTLFFSKGNRAFIEMYQGYLQASVDGSSPGTNIFNTLSGLKTLVWQHIAFCRKGTTWYMFIDGALVGTTTSTGNFGATSTAININGYQGTSNQNSYIDEVRISKVCRYTAAFTPPTQAFAVDPVTAQLSTAFGTAKPIFTTAPTAATTILNYLATINATFGTSLLSTDVVDGPIAAGATSIVLTAASTSYVYVAGSTVTLTQGKTLALLHFDGANGQTTTTSDTGRAVTLSGATLQTAVKKFGTASYSGAAAGYALLGTSADFALAADFTLEGFFTPVAADLGSTNESMLFSSGAGSYLDYYENGWYMSLGASNVHIFNGIGPALTAGTTYHVALTRRGTLVTLWINGASIGTATSSLPFGAAGNSFYVGNYQSLTIGWKGSIDEVRVTQGLARYTAAFTPPAAAFTAD